MHQTPLNLAAFVVLLVGFFAGTAVAKRGGSLLSNSQRTELAALGPDVFGIAISLGIVVLGFLFASYGLWSILGAIALFALGLIRTLVRLRPRSWPNQAKVQLILGNSLLLLGAFGFAVISAWRYLWT